MHFTESHEWVRIEGNIATIGISSYAQKELGEIVSIELPLVGRMVKAKEEVAVLESTKAAADVYAPLSGKVIAVNETIKQNPSQINQHAETSGWLFKLDLSHPQELTHLMNEKEYRALISHTETT